ncbi:snRNA-activating protein complex subunit 3-like [Lemur catta]|uniref:snRNA-activating protein complex subunit 3-like n=1 Tax=Lemur catta TaxID=9447 RepID=UPI001E26BDEE|nr:snRNA-activating protein complex subunit 3-like [Lemur catta]
MAEGGWCGSTCSGVLGRQDQVSNTGGCNFPEHQLPELSTPTFLVGAFGGCGVAGCAGRGPVAEGAASTRAARAWRGRGLGPGGCRRGAGSGLQSAGGGRAQGDVRG